MSMHPIFAGFFMFAVSMTPGFMMAQSAGTSSQGGAGATGAGATQGTMTAPGSQPGSTQSGSSERGTAGSSMGKGSTTGASQGTASMDPKSFVKEAAEGNMAEVKLGQLAQKKSSNADVKSFGERMVTDHSKANDQLKQTATSENIMVPTSMGSKYQKTYNKLSKLSGARFDQAYMKEMVEDHQKDVNTYEKASTGLSDPQLREYASNTLPILQQHLEMARNIEQQLTSGNNKKTSMKQTTTPNGKVATSAAH